MNGYSTKGDFLARASWMRGTHVFHSGLSGSSHASVLPDFSPKPPREVMNTRSFLLDGMVLEARMRGLCVGLRESRQRVEG